MSSPSNTALRPLSLRFDDEATEKAYLRDTFSDYRGPIRFAVAVGVFLFAIYAGVDRYIFEEWNQSLLIMRAGVCALGLGLIGVTYRRDFGRWVRPYMSLLHVAAGSAMIYLSTLHPSYEGGVYAAMMFFALLARAQYLLAMFINGVLLVVFVGLIERPEDVRPMMVDISMMFSAVIVIGLGAWIKERSERMEFVQKQAAAEARDRALAASRAKSTFLANMSHELRTPLNAIIGYGEMVKEDVEDAGLDACAEDLDKVIGSAKHLLGLINDILDLAKIEAGKVEIMAEDLDVAELVDGVAATIRPLVERNGNELEKIVSNEVGTICSDQTRIRQILMNLLSNASKFTKKGTITFSAQREVVEQKEAIVFVVKDTGIGMTEEQQEHIFDSFRQADASTTRDYGGTGLGLTITMHFCKLLGGGITVSSVPNEGSEFRAWLPVQAPRASV